MRQKRWVNRSLSNRTRDVAENVQEMEKSGRKLPEAAEQFKVANRAQKRSIAKKVAKR